MPQPVAMELECRDGSNLSGEDHSCQRFSGAALILRVPRRRPKTTPPTPKRPAARSVAAGRGQRLANQTGNPPLRCVASPCGRRPLRTNVRKRARHLTRQERAAHAPHAATRRTTCHFGRLDGGGTTPCQHRLPQQQAPRMMQTRFPLPTAQEPVVANLQQFPASQVLFLSWVMRESI